MSTVSGGLGDRDQWEILGDKRIHITFDKKNNYLTIEKRTTGFTSRIFGGVFGETTRIPTMLKPGTTLTRVELNKLQKEFAQDISTKSLNPDGINTVDDTWKEILGRRCRELAQADSSSSSSQVSWFSGWGSSSTSEGQDLPPPPKSTKPSSSSTLPEPSQTQVNLPLKRMIGPQLPSNLEKERLANETKSSANVPAESKAPSSPASVIESQHSQESKSDKSFAEFYRERFQDLLTNNTVSIGKEIEFLDLRNEMEFHLNEVIANEPAEVSAQFEALFNEVLSHYDSVIDRSRTSIREGGAKAALVMGMHAGRVLSNWIISPPSNFLELIDDGLIWLKISVSRGGVKDPLLKEPLYNEYMHLATLCAKAQMMDKAKEICEYYSTQTGDYRGVYNLAALYFNSAQSKSGAQRVDDERAAVSYWQQSKALGAPEIAQDQQFQALATFLTDLEANMREVEAIANLEIKRVADLKAKRAELELEAKK